MRGSWGGTASHSPTGIEFGGVLQDPPEGKLTEYSAVVVVSSSSDDFSEYFR